MGQTSKDLLQLEHKSSSSSLESTLLVCQKDSASQVKKPIPSDGKPITAPVPKSQVLGKVKDFLGIMSEANKRLELDAKENSDKYDIEALTGKESEVIELDLMLGIADLKTPEAVAAAESAMAGSQLVPVDASTSETESEDSSEDDDDESDESGDHDGDDSKSSETDDDDVNYKKTLPGNLKRPESVDKSSDGTAKRHKSNKRPKIVELS